MLCGEVAIVSGCQCVVQTACRDQNMPVAVTSIVYTNAILSVCLSVCLCLSVSRSVLFDVFRFAVFVIGDRFVEKPTSA